MQKKITDRRMYKFECMKQELIELLHITKQISRI